MGKEGSSGIWCTWCKSNWKVWAKKNHNLGDPWTLKALNELREKLERNEVVGTSNNRMGVSNLSLLSCFDIFDYIYPVLHSEIGTGNFFLNSFMDWVDFRIENICEEERNKKRDYGEILRELVPIEQKMDEFNNNEGVDLIDQRESRSHLKDIRGMRDDDDEFVSTLEERKEIDEMVDALSDTIKVLMKKKKDLEADLTLKRRICRLLKKELDEYSAKRGNKGNVRKQLEKVLEKYGISRPAYHGGDLTGVKIKVMLQKIDLIFHEFSTILKGVSTQDREDVGADNEEIETMLNMYRDLGFLMDGVYSLARTEMGKLSEEKIDLTRRMVAGVLKMWRHLRLSVRGPKIHGLEDHLVEQMIAYNGIGDYCEDFVEQSHQDGVKEELRTHGLKRTKAFLSHSKWEWSRNQISVIKAKHHIKSATGRKRKRGVEERIAERKLSRIEKRNLSLERVESGTYSEIQDYRMKRVEVDEEQDDNAQG